MTADSPRNPTHTTPRTADIRLVIAGVVGVLLGLIADPVMRRIAPSLLTYVVGLLMICAVVVVLAALPALLLRGMRGDWRGFANWWWKGLVAATIVVTASGLRKTTGDRPASLVQSLQDGHITISAFLRAERAAAPTMFDERLVETHERAMKASLPGFSRLALSEITEGDSWLRAHMIYTIDPTAQNGDVSRHGHLVVYYHPSGMAALGAVCSGDERKCPRLEELLADAEQALRARLRATTLDSVLPESPACSTAAVPLLTTGERSDVRTCAYSPTVYLTLTRLDAAVTIESLIAERASGR